MTPPIKALDEKFCSECGSPIKAKAEICPKCGVRQMSPPGGRTKTAAALFAFFLGGLGAHKFYLGQIAWGVVYMLFCWTFIPTIVAFFEFIFLLAMSDEAFNQKFNKV